MVILNRNIRCAKNVPLWQVWFHIYFHTEVTFSDFSNEDSFILHLLCEKYYCVLICFTQSMNQLYFLRLTGNRKAFEVKTHMHNFRLLNTTTAITKTTTKTTIINPFQLTQSGKLRGENIFNNSVIIYIMLSFCYNMLLLFRQTKKYPRGLNQK